MTFTNTEVVLIAVLFTLIVAMFVFGIDSVEKNKHHRRQTVRQTDLAHSSARVAELAMTTENLDELFRAIEIKMRKRLNVARAHIYHAPTRGLELYTFGVQQTTLVPDVNSDRRFINSEPDMYSALATVVPGDGTPWGTISVYDFTDRVFAIDEIFYVETIARMVGETIRRRDNYDMYKLLAESGNDMISLLDKDFKMVYVSPAVSTILGYSNDEMIRLMNMGNAPSIVHPDDVETVIQARDELVAGKQLVEISIRLKKQAGGWGFVETSYWAIRREGRFDGARVATRDITAQVETAKLKDHLISMAAHELRTPLTSVQGYAQMLLRADEIAAVHKYAQNIARETKQLNEIIGSLLELDPAQLGKMIFKPEINNMCDAVQLYVDRVKEYHPQDADRVVCSCLDEDLYLPFDEVRLGRAVVNLIENALKYSTEKVVVTVYNSVSHVCVRVSDAGLGICPDDIKQIFEPYFRSDRAELQGLPGMGLGLTIAKTAVKLHGGVIDVESEVNKGTTMTIKIPK